MTIIGNHMKFNVHKSLRERVRSFYLDVLQCTTMPSPAADLDLFLFSDTFVLGVFFCEQADVLSEEDHLKAACQSPACSNSGPGAARIRRVGGRASYCSVIPWPSSPVPSSG